MKLILLTQDITSISLPTFIIPPIMIINRIYETQNLLLLNLVSFLVGLRTYQHPCMKRIIAQLEEIVGKGPGSIRA
jgi:hypothetical protein